ncbi:MAG: protein kinase [Acidobacteria bacterium]|nr:protein kinase [Acidobacteriota bacterium]
MRFLLLAFLRLIGYAVDIVLWGIILAFLIRLFGVLSPAAAINDWELVVSLRKVLDPALTAAGTVVGLKWPAETGPGRFFPLAPAVVVYGIKVAFRRGLDLWRWQVLESTAASKARGRGGKDEEEEDASLIFDSWKSREHLLKQYRAIEKKLHSVQKRRCVLLNIDVVGSTKMKTGETPTAIAASFQAYEELLRRIFKRNKAWKQSWTPDGVLICFREREQAVHAAQQVLGALRQFNSAENRLRMPFRVRCGVSEGDLALFDDTNLSTFSDPVIDTAAHLQKEARANALCVSEEISSALPDRAEFRPTGRDVDGLKVHEWSLEPLPPGAEPSLLTPSTPTPVIPLAPAPAPPPPAAPSRAAIPLPPAAAPPAAPPFYAQPPVAAPPVFALPPAVPMAVPIERTIASNPIAAQAVRAIGRYEIVEELGRGAMGAVYKAIDPQIGRTVALKVILTRGLMDEEMRSQKERFYREARAAGKLLHPGIVAIYDVAEDSFGSPYLVMEFVEGTTLDKALSPGGTAQSFTFSQRLSLAIEIARALDYAHRNGVIHRDIKPANILMTRDGHPKIADFGIAKLVGSQATIGGHVLGTPAFVSPEQLTGSSADARSDIFSLGVVLYWIFTGDRPFKGETLTAMSYKVVHTMPPPARQLNWALPEEIDTILFRCLAKNPADRYQTASELAAVLETLRDVRVRLES